MAGLGVIATAAVKMALPWGAIFLGEGESAIFAVPIANFGHNPLTKNAFRYKTWATISDMSGP